MTGRCDFPPLTVLTLTSFSLSHFSHKSLIVSLTSLTFLTVFFAQQVLAQFLCEVPVVPPEHRALCAPIGCDGVENSGRVFDLCGVCDGDGSTCADVCGKPNGHNSTCIDACGVLFGDNR